MRSDRRTRRPPCRWGILHTCHGGLIRLRDHDQRRGRLLGPERPRPAREAHHRQQRPDSGPGHRAAHQLPADIGRCGPQSRLCRWRGRRGLVLGQEHRGSGRNRDINHIRGPHAGLDARGNPCSVRVCRGHPHLRHPVKRQAGMLGHRIIRTDRDYYRDAKRVRTRRLPIPIRVGLPMGFHPWRCVFLHQPRGTQ